MGEGAARTCPSCSQAVQAEWRTCPWCSAALPTPHGPLVKPCPACGANVWVKATHCARCGVSMATPAAAAAAQPPAFTAPPPAEEPEAPRRRRFAGLRRGLGDRGTALGLGVTLALIVAVGGVVVVIGDWNGIGQAVGPSCSFGVTGTAASITVRGWSSGTACQALRTGANFQTYDLPREATNQPVICDYPLLNNRIVVHDQAAGTAGGTLCQALHNVLIRPSSPPSP